MKSFLHYAATLLTILFTVLLWMAVNGPHAVAATWYALWTAAAATLFYIFVLASDWKGN